MRVQVHLRAEKLGNITRGGRWLLGKKSSPYATVSLADGSGPSASTAVGAELGKTEVIHSNLSPKWTTIFTLNHDESQSWTPLKITLYDGRTSAKQQQQETNADPNSNDRQSTEEGFMHVHAPPIRMNSIMNVATRIPMPHLYKSNSDPMMGEANVEVGDILKMEGQEMKLELEQGGCLYVHITESIDSQTSNSRSEQQQQSTTNTETETFHCHIRGLDLENIEKGLLGLGAIDPYFELSKKYNDPQHGISRWTCVYRSEHIPNIINPYWHPFSINLEKICHGNISKELKITVWDSESGVRSDRWIGECTVSVEELMDRVTKCGNAGRDEAICILDEEHQEVGLIVVLKADIVQ